VGAFALSNVANVSTAILHFTEWAARPYYPDPVDTAEDHVVLFDLTGSGEIDRMRTAVTSHVSNLWRRIKAARERGIGPEASPEATR
jgi:hypothetical protein